MKNNGSLAEHDFPSLVQEYHEQRRTGVLTLTHAGVGRSVTLQEGRLANELTCVEDGEELLDYLHQRGKWAGGAPRPGLILLDLNMPKLDGREALRAIKADPSLRQIPIVVFTSDAASIQANARYSFWLPCHFGCR